MKFIILAVSLLLAGCVYNVPIDDKRNELAYDQPMPIYKKRELSLLKNAIKMTSIQKKLF